MEPNVFTGKYFYGTGRRKSAVARVRLYSGKGTRIIVNNKKGDYYFSPSYLIDEVVEPLRLVGMSKDYDISARVSGGGMMAQADAIRHGVARALVALDANFKTTLKKAGYITRDARVKERKKPGLKRARRAPQFSKR